MGEGYITRRGGTVIGKGFPEFTYTGAYQMIDDSPMTGCEYDFRIKFLTSGTLRFTKLGKCNGEMDVFCVGGGGGGSSGNSGSSAGGAGGSGYTTTSAFTGTVKTGVDYPVIVGAGGAPMTNTSSFGTRAGNGGESRCFGVFANGGYGASGYNGGSGGSGGGAGNGNNNGTQGGFNGSTATSSIGTGGTGQLKTTREFGETQGDIYAGGGSAKGQSATVGGGGAGGGGSGIVNTGGGGGNAGTGGSGIVVIRNHRDHENELVLLDGSYVNASFDTKGWATYTTYSGKVTKLETYSYEGYRLEPSNGGNQAAGIYCGPIDLSEYKAVHVFLSNATTGSGNTAADASYISVNPVGGIPGTTEGNLVYFGTPKFPTQNALGVELILDVSHVQGARYVFIGYRTCCLVRKVWLTK